VWNATNDPLLGWISDKWRSDTVRARGQLPVLIVCGGVVPQDWDRTSAIRYGGFMWVLAFVATWVEWGTGWLAGVHFVVMLCFYDGMLTYVEVTSPYLIFIIVSILRFGSRQKPRTLSRCSYEGSSFESGSEGGSK